MCCRQHALQASGPAQGHHGLFRHITLLVSLQGSAGHNHGSLSLPVVLLFAVPVLAASMTRTVHYTEPMPHVYSSQLRRRTCGPVAVVLLPPNG